MIKFHDVVFAFSYCWTKHLEFLATGSTGPINSLEQTQNGIVLSGLLHNTVIEFTAAQTAVIAVKCAN